MEEFIARIICDYAKADKPLDNDLIVEIAKIVIDYKKLDDYVKKLTFTKDLNDLVFASYGSIEKEISLNFAYIYGLVDTLSCFMQLFTGDERLIFIYLIIIQNLLHELEHAHQARKYDIAVDRSLETMLIRACNKPFFIPDGLYTSREEAIAAITGRRKQYYLYDPMERLAEIKSMTETANVVKCVRREYPELFSFMQSLAKERYLLAYAEANEVGLCPTQIYLDGVGRHDEWKKFSFYSDDNDELIRKVSKKYSLEFRLKHGLPVSMDEYNWYAEPFKKTKRYQIAVETFGNLEST